MPFRKLNSVSSEQTGDRTAISTIRLRSMKLINAVIQNERMLQRSRVDRVDDGQFLCSAGAISNREFNDPNTQFNGAARNSAGTFSKTATALQMHCAIWRTLSLRPERLHCPFSQAKPASTRYLEETRRFAILEPQEEFILAKRWREHGDDGSAHRLVTSHLRLVAKIAMSYRGYGLLEFEKMLSEGNVGLMQAVKRFEDDKENWRPMRCGGSRRRSRNTSCARGRW